jgi:hypothetical protein
MICEGKYQGKLKKRKGACTCIFGIIHMCKQFIQHLLHTIFHLLLLLKVDKWYPLCKYLGTINSSLCHLDLLNLI